MGTENSLVYPLIVFQPAIQTVDRYGRRFLLMSKSKAASYVAC